MTAAPDAGVQASGRLLAIARRSARREAMQQIDRVEISTERGLEGDHKGARFPLRAVTVLSREAWEEAVATLGSDLLGPVSLPWTVRRANLLVEGVRLPRARGGIVRIGPVLLEITYPTQPCARMDEAHAGLLKALHPDWRGGICCKVLEGGVIEVGAEVRVEFSPVERVPRLPG